MFRNRLIRVTCIALVCTVVPLAILLAAGTWLGWFSGGGSLSPEGYRPHKWDRPKLDLTGEETRLPPEPWDSLSQEEIDQLIEDIINKIDGLPGLGDLSLDDKAAIMAILGLLGKLSESLHPLIPNLSELMDAVDRLEELENSAGESEIEIDTRPGGGTSPIPEPDGIETLPVDGLPTGQVVFKLFSEVGGTFYLKQSSFGDYNGQGFAEAEAYPQLIDGQYAADYLAWFSSSSATAHRMRIDPLTSGLRLQPYYPALGEGATAGRSDTVADGDASVPYLCYFMSDVGSSAVLSTPALMAYEREYRTFVHDRYLSVDPATVAFLSDIIAAEGFDADDPAVIGKVAAYIQGAATYNLRYDRAMDSEANVAVAFLRDYKEGICVHYATAATLLYRALGIPARYTVGFMVNAEANTSVDVRDDRGHAWVEVYIDGLGWQYVEVTGSGSAGTPGGGSSDAGGSGGSGGDAGDKVERKLVFSLAGERVRYDGRPHSYGQTLQGDPVTCPAFDAWAAQGYTYAYTLDGRTRRTRPGRYAVSIQDLVIRDPDGQDVTESFTIETKDASLQIYLAMLVLESEDITLAYSGRPQTGDASAYRVDTEASAALNGMSEEELLALLSAHGVTTLGAEGIPATHAGKHTADMALVAKGEDGRDCSDLFYVLKRRGELVITPAPLTVVAASASKEFDPSGTPLTAQDWGFGAGTHTLGDDAVTSVLIEGSQLYPGTADNLIKEVVIRNTRGEDVTGNYRITYIKGTLSVTWPSD